MGSTNKDGRGAHKHLIKDASEKRLVTLTVWVLPESKKTTAPQKQAPQK